MVRMLFVPTQQVYIFEKNLIVHGKPSIENLGQLGCIPTYAALDIYSNTEIFHANADRVSFLVYLAGDTMMEILNFSWECEVYTKDFGPCDNPTLNAGSILVRHIAGYTKYFVRHFNLNSTLEQALFDRASMIWLDAVAKLRERQEQNDIQVDITPNKADQV